MKDLVPKGTGNSRFLRSSIPANITHEELVTLLRAGTFPVDFAGLNSAGVAVVGSAYNKANVLPDDVCSAIGVATNAEPKDAFLKLSDANRPYKLLEKITASKFWTCPDGVFCITALIVGGGGGGGGGGEGSTGGGGGQGGACLLARDIGVTPGQSYQIIIGNGGAAGTTSATTGYKGGDTSAFGLTAIGGSGGELQFGGRNPAAGSYGGDEDSYGTYNGPETMYLSAGGNAINPVNQAERLYFDLLYNDWYGSGGGGGSSMMSMLGGPNAGNGGDVSTGADAVANFGGGGGGGGSGYNRDEGEFMPYPGGKGGSGAVLIYVRGD